MNDVHVGRKLGSVLVATAVVVLVFFGSSVTADTISSPNYKINGNLGGSFGGRTTSSSYAMTAIGGETVVGQGQSGSYIIDQQQVDPAAPSMQLSVQPSGLAAYYPLNENTGTVSNDASANSNNGSLINSPTWTTGQLGSALSFDGSAGQSFRVADNAALTMSNKMTLSVWANQNSLSGNKALASHWDYVSGSNSASWGLQTDGTTSSRLQFFVGNSQTDPGNNYVVTDTGTWASGGWHHIVVVYDGAQSNAIDRVAIYIDNVKVSTSMVGTIPTSLQNANSPMMIGDFNGLNRTWNGAIDHVKLFNRDLSASEVRAEYTAQNNGIPTGLTLGALTDATSTTSLVDAIVRTNIIAYGLSVQQDHNLQSGVQTIPAVSGSIASPATWTEGATQGLGFTVTGAPMLDSKWGAGSKYAAFPGSATTFYNESDHNISAAAVINLRMRLGISPLQVSGAYSNEIVYTGTTLP